MNGSVVVLLKALGVVVLLWCLVGNGATRLVRLWVLLVEPHVATDRGIYAESRPRHDLEGPEKA